MPVASLPHGGGGRSELGWVEQAMVGPSRQKNPKETKVLTNRGGSRILEGGGAIQISAMYSYYVLYCSV